MSEELVPMPPNPINKTHYPPEFQEMAMKMYSDGYKETGKDLQFLSQQAIADKLDIPRETLNRWLMKNPYYKQRRKTKEDDFNKQAVEIARKRLAGRVLSRASDVEDVLQEALKYASKFIGHMQSVDVEEWSVKDFRDYVGCIKDLAAIQTQTGIVKPSDDDNGGDKTVVTTNVLAVNASVAAEAGYNPDCVGAVFDVNDRDNPVQDLDEDDEVIGFGGSEED